LKEDKLMVRLHYGLMVVLLLLPANLAAQAQQPQADSPRGYLGVRVGPAEEGGTSIAVLEVTPDSAAAKAGLQKGDRIVKLDGEEIRDVDRFLRTVAAKKPGDKISLGVLRNGKEENLAVTLGERPAQAQQPGSGFPGVPGGLGFPGGRAPAFLGVQTQPGEGGVVVTDVVPNSPAAKAGLRRDDIITAVDNQPVTSPEELRDAIQKAGAGKEVTLQVVRGKEKQTIKATLQSGGAGGFFGIPGGEQFPQMDMGSLFDQGRRIRELERRVSELEKRLKEVDKK
jgi:serine protease Do